MPDPLREARVRAQRYWYRDGLSEITAGAVFLLVSGSNLINALGNRTSSWFEPAFLIYTLLFAALAIFSRRISLPPHEKGPGLVSGVRGCTTRGIGTILGHFGRDIE